MSTLVESFYKFADSKKPAAIQKESLDTWSGNITHDTAISECPFVVFDTELSGLSPRKDFIVSIGALKLTGGTIHAGKEFSRLIKPSGKMTKESIEIHGITPDELIRGDTIEAVLPEFLEFIKDSVLVGHFIHIDLMFINKSLKKHFKTTLKNPAVDTYTIHEWLYENAADFKKHYNGGSIKTDLFSIAKRYGIPVDIAHDALNDAYITAQLFQRFGYFFRPNGVVTLGDLIDIGRA